ncbi:restriction endonuclease subunit S [Fluviicola taffensis]|uniref:Restriction modification system DNA specificity domain protein n=1 Tax=Fluviicola taffensis (strain DSM 16823 / NCIMB 13979 / RW262) TaxID=755732 RepID=F2IGS4_FLUTR|nr:restriction endonuclease subunit S [Fluviicola taffensis]AEA43691.1 restriction modification system DNA specificity domain protein [Fluviicola taffensis DSM 16823]
MKIDLDFIPKGWKKVKIPKVLFFQEGPGVRNWQFTESGVKLLNVGNINNGKVDLNSTSIHLSDEEANGKYSHFLVDEGDLLIACSGIVVSNFHNKIAIAEKSHLPLCLNTSTMRFKSIESKIDLNYFKYYLQTVYFTAQLQKLITGSAQLNFGPSHIKKIDILLPPLETQKRIAQILDDGQALKQKTELLLKEYDALAQSIFMDMFGDPVRNPNTWKKVKLEKLCGVGSSKRVFVEDLVESGVPFYRGTEVGSLGAGLEINPKLFITKKHYEELKTHTGVPKVGDLLLPSICPDGRIFRVISENPFYFKDGRVLWIKVNQEKINSVYLKTLLKSIFYSNYSNIASGSTFAELKIFALKKIDLLLPDIKLQNLFAEKIELIDKQKELAKQELKESEDLFNCLLQKAFKGELV